MINSPSERHSKSSPVWSWSWRSQGLWLAAFAFVTSAFLYALGPKPLQQEPVYKGAGLSVWLDRYDDGDATAQSAVMAIGTNAIPTLVKMLHARDPWVRRQVYEVAALFRIEGIGNDSAVHLRLLALAGFKLLGPTAANAVTNVLPFLYDTNVSYAASWAVSATGSDGVRALAEISRTNSSPSVRCAAISGLGRAETSRGFALTALAHCANDQHFAVRAAAARAIGLLKECPTDSIPVLIAAASETNRVVRCAALEALGLFGEEAKQAVVIVLDAVDSGDPLVRSAAVTALNKIVSSTKSGREKF